MGQVLAKAIDPANVDGKWIAHNDLGFITHQNMLVFERRHSG